MDLNIKKRSIHDYTSHVGSITKQRIQADKKTIIVRNVILLAEYIGYIITFYLLMALRVIPLYQNVSRYNPVEWFKYINVFNEYTVFLGILLILYTFTLIQKHLHSGMSDRPIWEEFVLIFKSILFSFLITIGITFLLKTTFLYSRLTLGVFILSMLVESLVWLVVKRSVMNYMYRKGSLRKNILIIGAGKVGLDIYNKVVCKGGINRFVGYLDDNKKDEGVVGKIADLERILQQERIDTVYITIPSEKNLIDSMLRTVYKYNIDIRIIPEMFNRMSTVFAFRDDLEYPCLQLVKTPLRGINVALKRLADLCGSAFLLVLLTPLLIIIAGLIKLNSQGPVFYKQKRIGKNGLSFNMVKFRSMYNRAESVKERLIEQNEMTGPVFKMRNDPRITSIGRLLRKYSLDELPQLWNVLRGEMSLIGPRPPLPEEVASYSDYHWRRMDVLPGMTGLWQISGRSDLEFDKWIDLDIYYIEHWSFLLEMKILFKTIPVVVKGTGAY